MKIIFTNKNLAGFAALAALAMIFMAGCAKPPVEEMNNAVAAVARAENDPDAVAYSANTLARARDALNSMQTESDAKRYDAAKQYALEAENLAQKAIADAKNAIGRQRDEAAQAITTMNGTMMSTEQTLQNARSSGGTGLDMERLDRDFAAARQTAGQAETANNEGRYRDALDRSQTARSAFSAISAEISQGTLAVNRKK
jgi:hypothetical protein